MDGEMKPTSVPLADLVGAELAVPVDPRVVTVAEAMAARYGTAARAALFYGSCLRTAELDGQMLDFYLIVSDYDAAYGKSWLAVANRLIPPNVFPIQHDGLAAKYAVLSEADFYRLCGPETDSVSVWARFAQPSRLVWRADEAAAAAAIRAVSRAAPTLLAAARPLFDGSDALELWRSAFALTYAAELRAERHGRARSVVDADPERYRAFLYPALAAAGLGWTSADGGLRLGPSGSHIRDRAKRAWARRRRRGKLLSLVRLAKASGTYAGGIDYLAWKINRHSGTHIELTDWQRRWPLLGAVTLLPRLWRQQAIR
jgi:hypothetical protein